MASAESLLTATLEVRYVLQPETRFANLLGIACLAAFTATAADLRISGPFTHENLSVYLLHSSVQKARRPQPADFARGDGAERKPARDTKTGKVEELAIENLSSQPAFVQAGDIAKAGSRRVLTTDLLLPPRSGKVSIAIALRRAGPLDQAWRGAGGAIQRVVQSSADARAQAGCAPSRAAR
jgi:hypothetical protein